MRSSKRFWQAAGTGVAALLCGYGLWQAYTHVSATVAIVADGMVTQTRPRGRTVAEILAEQRIILGALDLVTPPPDTVPSRHQEIRVVRVTERCEKQDEYLPFKVRWKKRMEDNLRPVELQRGIQHRKTIEVRIVYHDGKETERQVVRERMTTTNVYRLVLLTADGGIEKFYDLSKCKKIRMVATAYYPGDPLAWKDGTVTRLGHRMQRGIVAVDPKVIPLRTRVFVSQYGYGYAGDTGSAIKNKRIDLGVNNAEEEKSWMHRPVTVYILEKNPTW